MSGWSRAAAVVVGVYVVVVWATEASVGFVRDEGYYFKAAQLYAGWFSTLFSSRFFDAFSDAEILKHFGYNREHPPLAKLAQGATFSLFHATLGLVRPSTGFRVAGFLFAGLTVGATYLLGRRLVSARVGFFGALMMAAMPRFFFDAHLACFDVAITAMWTLSIWAFVRALTAPPSAAGRRAMVAGLVFGLALATKLNALFLPVLFVAWWLVAPPAGLRFGRRPGPSGGLDVVVPPIPVVLLSCAVIGPVVFVACWPYLWHDPIARIGGYLAFHLNHEHYPALYFHELLVAPPFPWHFPVVMTALTVPTSVLALGAVGLAVSLGRVVGQRSLPDAVLVFATVLPVALIAVPHTPIFGGVKHWYNALPTLCLLAARSLVWVGVEVERFLAARGARAFVTPLAWGALALLALAPGMLGIARSHPDGIGFYNEWAGGFRGGAALGMQRGFWGGLAHPRYIDTLPDLAGGRGRVFFNRTNYDAYRMYQREGKVPKTMHYANDASNAVVGVHFAQPEHGEQEGHIWSAIGTRPVAGVYRDGVTLIQLYAAPESRSRPKER